MQRVFFSIHVPESTGTTLLKNLQSQVQFPLYQANNLHITLQFVGEVTDEQLEQLKNIGEEISQEYQPIPILPASFFVEQGRLRMTIKKDSSLLTLHEQ